MTATELKLYFKIEMGEVSATAEKVEQSYSCYGRYSSDSFNYYMNGESWYTGKDL